MARDDETKSTYDHEDQSEDLKPAGKKREGKKPDQSILQEIKDTFEESDDAEADNRRSAKECIEFARLGRQWPEAVRLQREKDQRPCLTINKMNTFIRQVVNEARMNKPSIKVRPVDSRADPKVADIYSGLIRNIESTSDADVAYDTGNESAVVGGFGYWRVVLDYTHEDSFDLDIKIKRIRNPFTVWRDPYSQEADGSDWNRCHIGQLLHKELFAKKYGKAEQANWSMDYQGLEQRWMQGDDIRVMEYWKRRERKGEILLLFNPLTGQEQVIDGEIWAEPQRQRDFLAAGCEVRGNREVRRYEVCQYIASGAEVLEEHKWPGKYIPVVPIYGDEVDEDGKVHLRSLVADSIDPQRNYNYWRSATTEMVALGPKAPWVGPKGSFASDKNWKTANRETHAFLEYDVVEAAAPPQRVPFDSAPAGALQEAANADGDIKGTMGMYDASLGNRSNETSGAAITARQREGDVSTFHFTDNTNRAIRFTGRILVDLIPRVYTGKRIVRVMGTDADKNKTESVQLGVSTPQPDGTTVVYDLTAGKYDLSIEAGPNYATRRVEASTHMLEMMRANPQMAGLAGDLFVRNQDWPGAEELARRLEASLPPHLRAPNPAAAELQEKLKQAEQAIQTLQGVVADKDRQLQDKSEDTAVKGYDAETKRFAALTKVAPPEDPAALQTAVMQIVAEIMKDPNAFQAAMGMPMQQPQPQQPSQPTGGAPAPF